MNIFRSITILLFFSTFLFSQSLDSIKICIDPGHGGHDAANDRHIIIPDFWESEGNYTKALHAEEILTSLGATVIVTRSGNNDSDDLGLSVRSGIANANNVDLFHSIHSNATGTANRVNFPLMLYRGYTDAPVFPAAKTYAIKAFRNFEKVNHVQNKSYDVIYGDWTFYDWGTSGLGVLRNLTMPGVLSEGSFHDYIPEAFRLKNCSYLRHEAWAITRSILEHFNAGTLPNGNLGGILRDPLISVPSSYQPIAELGDTKKPLNSVKATLQPGNLVYNGDDQNNGYYFFENLIPGQYKLYVEAEDYSVDSADVTISANTSIFVNKNLTLVPNENFPNVVESYPLNNAENFSNMSNIEIQFDIQMDNATTESAFSITPNVAGTFSWEDNNKRLVFDPTLNLTAGQTYQVSISNLAKTIFDKNLTWGYDFQFTTRLKLNLLSYYPADGSSDISQSVEVRFQFDQAINAGTLGGNISFQDSDGKSVTPSVDFTAYSKGIISFTPVSDLKIGGSYKVLIGEKIGDIEGVTFQENLEINFTVEDQEYNSGEIIDDFETAGNWKTPQNSGSVGISEETNFEINSSKKYSGTYSGALNYGFNDNNGQFKVSRVNPVSVGNNSESMFGLWVYGELSNNILEYWFSDASSNLYSIEVDTLNFTGWKMKSIKHGDVFSGDLNFEGVGVKQTDSGISYGKIYIDDAQYNFTTPVENKISDVPNKYSLTQNYPNPFNPSTIIKYSIPATTKDKMLNTKLVVFDILGREIATLVNQNQKAGNYEVKFDASKFSSGIYFYKLSSGNFVNTKKMMLIK
ncbi:MAG: Ig-like domain-containing protein [Bacteroidetes bacterium]|nr:Ig-like domain-containing protein [Bacteroidota bacterium]MBU1114979.1 Ig-like domain-containing protein [Bacteroidota bacterium]MBU1799249.1 Ig-like domain-containing protein [Bacteroidota bacterium]